MESSPSLRKTALCEFEALLTAPNRKEMRGFFDPIIDQISEMIQGQIMQIEDSKQARVRVGQCRRCL